LNTSENFFTLESKINDIRFVFYWLLASKAVLKVN
jgi:hypothetical protein